MAEKRRRTGLTSGVNLLTNLLIQSNQDELTRQRRAEDLRAQTEQRFQEEIGLRQINRGVDPITGRAIPGLQPQAITPTPGLEPTGQTFDEFGNLKGTSFGRPFKTETEEVRPLDFSKEFELKDLLGGKTVELKDVPSDPSARETIKRGLGRSFFLSKEASDELGVPFVEAPETGIRSLGQRILPFLQSAFGLQSQQPAQAPRAIPITPLPKTVQSRQGGFDFSETVEEARKLLEQGADPNDLIDHFIQKGVDPQTAQQIVEEASR